MTIEEVARKRLAQAEQHRQLGAVKDAEALEASVERLYQQAKQAKSESESAKLRRVNRGSL
jgi:hypothetical protein